MEYAHRNQKRENGDDYAMHSFRCMERYRCLIGNTADDNFRIDKDLIDEYEIPFEGVQEVCLLHDVIEDADFTLEDLEEIFNECDFGLYFRLYMKEPLKLITHKEDVKYQDYILMCMQNSISSICKMMDFQDNSNALTLKKFDRKKLERIHRYQEYLWLINLKFGFLEKIYEYKKKLNED